MTPTPSADPSSPRHDLLVVGGGPAGSATAYWAALAGLDVVVVEKKTFPREKTCGDGLTPRAVHQLDAMGLGEELHRYHRYEGLRAVAHHRSLELRWPEHPVFPSHGYVVRRRELDSFVAAHAEAAGADVRHGVEAVAPLLEDGLVVGARVKQVATGEHLELRARYVVVADGANSRFGRALGTRRNKAMPQGLAIRTYYESPLHAEPWIESALDLRDRNGASLPGYGWIFPVGDGTINVGVGLLSTFRDWRSINTSHLMAEFAATMPAYWEIDPEHPVQPPTGGRLPMGGSIHPKVGPTWVVVGDAAGSINPFNGEGIDYAYETGRLAASLVAECVVTGSGLPLQRYPQILEARYGLYFKVARLFAQVIGRPALMREMTRVGMRSRTLMDWVLRIMANLLRDDELGPAEAVYKAAASLARVVPEKSAA
jgi:geranylgeranyl reductase family protein